MKKHIALLAATTAVTSFSAQAVLVAGYETFSGESNTPTQLATGFASSLTGTSTVAGQIGTQFFGNANGPDNIIGASADGSFGSLSSSVASADTNTAPAGQNLSVFRSDAVFTLTVTNNTGIDQTIDTLNFDVTRRFGGAAQNFSIDFGGSISGPSIPSQPIANSEGPGFSNTDPLIVAGFDQSFDLSVLTDSVIADGEDAVFTLNFTGSSIGTNSGGNFLLLDNIGVTTAIPEPSSSLLALLGGIFLIRRRR